MPGCRDWRPAAVADALQGGPARAAESGAMAGLEAWRLDVLGPVALRHDGRPLPLPTHKLAGLLVLLALGGPTPRARAAAWLWPGLDEPAGRRNLRRELARLRDAGAGTLLAPGDAALLALAPQLDCDAWALQAASAAADDGALQAALARWRGSPADGLALDGCAEFADWLQAERERLATLRRRAWQRLADAAGDAQAAIAWLQQLADDDPVQETVHRRLMALHLAAGRRAEALAQYTRCRAVLARELGVAPMAETEALARRAQDEGAATRPDAGAGDHGPPIATTPSAAPAPLPLAGREAETAELTRAWATRRVMLLQGEGGIGKTRLATHVAAAQGAYALAQCRAGDAASPYAAFKRCLRLLAGTALDAAGLPPWVAAELSHLLPELGAATPRTATAEDRSRLHEAALAAWQHLAAGSFDAVVIDDWHLADSDSRQLFNALALALPAPDAPRWMFLLRPELDADGHAALAALEAAGALNLRLAPLDEPALLALVQRLSGAAAPRLFTRRLLAATGGNPFFVAETLAHWQALGLLVRDADGHWRTPFDEGTDDYRELPMPASVREAVLARVRRQPEAVQRLLQAAALAVEPFGPGLLAGACGLTETETLDALERALDAGLLRELGDGHAFAHDLVQAAVASTLVPERARLVHRRLALAAEAAALDAAEIARHWESGGEPRRAVPWRMAAAEQAGALGSWPAAEAHWAAALADDPTPEQHLQLLRRRWPALQARDDRPGLQSVLDELERLHERWRQHPASGRAAVQARLEQALILSLELRLRSGHDALALADEIGAAIAPDDPLQPELALARAQALNNNQRHDEAQRVVEAALQRPGVEPAMQARLLHTQVFGLFQLGQPQRALPYAQRVVHIRRASGDRRLQLRALANLGLVQSALGNQAAARAAMEEALELARALRMLDPQRELSNNLADIHLTEGRPAEALALADAALALSPHWARPRMRVFLLGMRVQALWQLGRLGEALAAADTALAVAREPDLHDANPLIDALSMQLDLFGFIGDVAEGTRRLALLATHAGARSPHFEIKLAFNRVHLALDAGDRAAAQAAMRDIGDPPALHEQRDREHAVLCAAALARAEGDAAAVRRWLDEHPAPQAHVEVAARRALLRLQAADGADTTAAQAAAAVALDARTPRPLAMAIGLALGTAHASTGAARAAPALRAQLLASLEGDATRQALLASRWPLPGPLLE